MIVLDILSLLLLVFKVPGKTLTNVGGDGSYPGGVPFLEDGGTGVDPWGSS